MKELLYDTELELGLLNKESKKGGGKEAAAIKITTWPLINVFFNKYFFYYFTKMFFFCVYIIRLNQSFFEKNFSRSVCLTLAIGSNLRIYIKRCCS